MANTLIIEEAKYFTAQKSIDVTKQLQAKALQGHLNILASNDIAGDPEYGKEKRLYVKYLLNGESKEITVDEGSQVLIYADDPIPSTKCFLSQSPKKPVLVKPLLNIERKPVAKKADLKTTFTDIIIPTYQNETYTVNCFRSIKQNTKPGTYRVIWVDNGSQNTENAAKELKNVNHIYVHFTENKGFVGAVNEGLRVSDAPSICFLNNDTEVSRGWLEKLNKALYADPKLGVVGALTGPPAEKQRYDSHHNIAYQQRAREAPVFPHYKNLEDFNRKIERQYAGLIGQIDFVAFLCALTKREVVDVVGFLDPNYEIGMWDDCDWNRLVKKAGYTVGLCLDTCIIHHGRSTFNLIQKKEGFNVQALLKKNKEYMDKKWKHIHV